MRKYNSFVLSIYVLFDGCFISFLELNTIMDNILILIVIVYSVAV